MLLVEDVSLPEYFQFFFFVKTFNCSTSFSAKSFCIIQKYFVQTVLFISLFCSA